jgi:glucose-1-phosphate adenylyltransferase
MLQQHVEQGADVTVACLEVPIEDAAGFGVMHVDEHDRIISYLEKPKDPPAMPGRPDVALASMGIYVFETRFLMDLLRRDAEDLASSHDFGQDIIPSIVASGKAVAHHFARSCVRSRVEAAPYWRDVGTVDAFWSANLDLASISPELNLYDRDWPIWTYQEQLPPAKFVFDKNGQQGVAVNTLVSGGCIIEGSHVSSSVLFSNVRVSSFSRIDQAVLLPGTEVGEGCRLSKVVVDRQCIIPAGTVIGEDAELDAQRFHRSETGVVLVTAAMLAALKA